MSPAVPPLASVTTIARLPPGARGRSPRRPGSATIRYASPEIDCDAGIVSRVLLIAAFAAARLQAGAAMRQRRGADGQHGPKLAQTPATGPAGATGRLNVRLQDGKRRQEPGSRGHTGVQMATKLAPLLCELHAHTTWSDGSLTASRAVRPLRPRRLRRPRRHRPHRARARACRSTTSPPTWPSSRPRRSGPAASTTCS